MTPTFTIKSNKSSFTPNPVIERTSLLWCLESLLKHSESNQRKWQRSRVCLSVRLFPHECKQQAPTAPMNQSHQSPMKKCTTTDLSRSML